MLIAVAALLLQFSVFTPQQSQSNKFTESATSTAERSAVPGKPGGSSTSDAEVLSAEARPSDAEAPMAFTPGRLVPEPVVPVVAAAAPTAAEPLALAPVYGPVYGPPIRAVSDQRQKREWLALSFAAHATAGFDAWSTRRVLSAVPGSREMNPFLRPFAGNASMYAAVQVAPAVCDYLSHRMMNSRHDLLRHTWWLPQAVSAAVSLSSGVHNMGVYGSR